MTHIKKIPEDIGEHLQYEDGKLFWKQQPGRRIIIQDEAGSLNKSRGYRRVKFKGITYAAHRVIWFLVKHEQPPPLLDHINNNPLDNRIENLREASMSQNLCNCAIAKNNTSGVKGVSWEKRRNKWKAYISTNNKRKALGYFSDLKDAEQAVKQARKELHGEFANNG